MLSEKHDGKMAKAGLLKPPRPKKCKVCRQVFVRTRPIQPCCGYECELVVATKNVARLKLKRERAAAERERAERRKTAAQKKALRESSPKWWAAKLKKVCHKYIRTRDAALPCISCGATEAKQFDAGHYHSSHRAAFLRYHPWNINKQCCACNDGNKLSGNVAMYRIGLAKKIGAENVEWLDANANNIKRWTIPEMKKLIEHFTKELQALE